MQLVNRFAMLLFVVNRQFELLHGSADITVLNMQRIYNDVAR